MSRDRTRLLALAAGAACIVPLAAASPAAAKSCPLTTKEQNSYPGQGYYTSLKATGISCSGAKDVMRAHYRCRTRNGIQGKCPRLNGWRCSEKRVSASTEYNSRVTCRKGSRTVVYTYNQDT